MSDQAIDLVNKMLILEPNHRLGGTPQSMPYLKQHPFFQGIDWNEISHKDYTGLRDMVEKNMPDEGKQYY